jgi:hypothetical protein
LSEAPPEADEEIGIAGVGIRRNRPERLSMGAPPWKGDGNDPFLGAVSIFMRGLSVFDCGTAVERTSPALQMEIERYGRELLKKVYN